MNALNKIKENLFEVWPEHQRFYEKSFDKRSSEVKLFTEKLAESVLKLIDGHLKSYIESYKWTCQMLTEEEVFFRRNGNYRYTKLNEVVEEVYNNKEFMTKYVQGLLLTQIFWGNHISTIFELNNIIMSLKPRSVLEIGPGHGLLLGLCAEHGVKDLTGWDISEASLIETKRNLNILAPELDIKYIQADALHEENFDKSIDEKDLIILSEVLEHIEHPIKLLENLKKVITKKSRIFINVPINCPAPDHIYFMDSKESAIKMVEASGLRIESVQEYPATGYTLEQARKRNYAISISILAML
jgi:2-polyprenyl-3-methyl-5-hydroxy-6-metoxy-1,4-benzoquinol methylase